MMDAPMRRAEHAARQFRRSSEDINSGMPYNLQSTPSCDIVDAVPGD
jgi:hypothetical protein